MNNAKRLVNQILQHHTRVKSNLYFGKIGTGFAPSNIALCKYWGKRDLVLNLPNTNSLSISLGRRGSKTHLQLLPDCERSDQIFLNGTQMQSNNSFAKRVSAFLDLFRFHTPCCYRVETTSTVPVAAGVASSASGFAALTFALDDLYDFGLSLEQLSILARLGSGSAARSVYSGFVEWEKGSHPLGLDCLAKPILTDWPQMRIGLLFVSSSEKPISSRQAMLRSVNTSPYYTVWPEKVAEDLKSLKKAIEIQDFSLLGKTSESNAQNMHALMHTSWPPICYDLAETVAAKHKVWQLRDSGILIFFTQDAGPNLKLLFLEENTQRIKFEFKDSHLEIIQPVV